MSTKRDEIIEATCRLVELQGYQATGLNQILTESGAPKGSLYHYFPGGKDELVEAAIVQTSALIATRLQQGMEAHARAVEAIPAFLRQLAYFVHESGYQAGGPITAVAVEAASTNPRLNAACHQAYSTWQEIIANKLQDDDYEPLRAVRLARVIIVIIEGAILLSRSAKNVAPLLDAAQEVEILLER